MARRSRSPRSSNRRHRSSSRSPPRRRERSRDRQRTEDSRKGSNQRIIDNVKRRMREQLESATSAPSAADSPTCAPRPFEDLSISEQASRAREIERIDEAGFQQSQFKSTAGGAGGRVYNQKKNVSKAERVDSAQNEHEKAIFGPQWMDKKMNKGGASSSSDSNMGIPLPPVSATSTASRLHPKFLEGPEQRKAAWLNSWREQRRSLGIQ